MIRVISIGLAANRVFNIGGILISVPNSIEYVTVDKSGKCNGWEDRPYFDEADEDWSNFNSYGPHMLADLDIDQDFDYSHLYEQQEWL